MQITPIKFSSSLVRNDIQVKNTTNTIMPNLPENSIKSKISNIYYQPVNFAGQKRSYETTKPQLKEKSGDFLICKFNDIPCPSCGKKMLNRTKYDAIVEELKATPSNQYLDVLHKYTDYMRPVEESVFNEITKLSEKPNASKDIRTLLVSLRDSKLPILQEVQMRQVKKMTALAKNLPEDEKKVLLSKLAKLTVEIRRKNATAPFRRKIMLDRISKVKIRNPKKYAKLQRIAANFPTSSDMNSAWIVKYSGKNKNNQDWNSFDIACRFLASSVANTDHIIAYDIKENQNDISNYIAMHNACNCQKSNKPFLQWLNEDRGNRIQYLEDYFTSVNDLIKSQKIKKKKYKHYVAYATRTIYEASKGEVKIFEDLYSHKKQKSHITHSDTEIQVPKSSTQKKLQVPSKSEQRVLLEPIDLTTKPLKYKLLNATNNPNGEVQRVLLEPTDLTTSKKRYVLNRNSKVIVKPNDRNTEIMHISEKPELK